MNMLEKGVFHIGVGTPGRVKALVEQGRRTRRVFSIVILGLIRSKTLVVFKELRLT